MSFYLWAAAVWIGFSIVGFLWATRLSRSPLGSGGCAECNGPKEWWIVRDWERLGVCSDCRDWMVTMEGWSMKGGVR